MSIYNVYYNDRYYAQIECTSPMNGVRELFKGYSIVAVDNNRESNVYTDLVGKNTKSRCYYRVNKKGVTFKDGEPKEIKAMLDAHYRGEIDIANYWHVGDSRTIEIKGLKSNDVQQLELVIIGVNHDDLVVPRGKRTKAALTLHTKYCLEEKREVAILHDNIQAGLWSKSKMRKWLSTNFRESLPKWVSKEIKTVTKLTNRYSPAIEQNGINYQKYAQQEITKEDVFLLSYSEITGKTNYNSSVFTKVKLTKEGMQYEYFKRSINRQNNKNRYIQEWWLRSSLIEIHKLACFLTVDCFGDIAYEYADYKRGVNPNFCI